MIPHYSFPRARFVDEPGIYRQLFHIISELWEILKALLTGDYRHAVHEAFDLIHSTETLIRKIVARSYKSGKPINPIIVKAEVIEKNRARGYYDVTRTSRLSPPEGENIQGSMQSQPQPPNVRLYRVPRFTRTGKTDGNCGARGDTEV